MAGRRVLVTGAAGFTGRYLTNLLAGQGHEVFGLAHSRPADPVEGIARLFEADLTDIDAVRHVVSEVRPDRVVHLAAIAFVAHGDVEQMYQTNVLGTRNLLESLTSIEAPGATLLASSANVYGNARAGVLDESVPVAPANDYGVTKVALENLAAIYASRLPLIVARPFNYTGRGQSVDFLIPKILSHVRRGAAEIELGNLDVSRDFSDVRGVVSAYARLIAAPAAIGNTYNVCSGRAVSLAEVLDLVRRISGRELAVRVNPAFVRAGEVKSLCGSAGKLEATIGPLDMPPLEDTIEWMLRD